MSRYWKVLAVVAAIMIGLVMVGVGLATASPQFAPRYWLWLVPVFGVLSVFAAWVQYRGTGSFGVWPVVRQLLHWSVIAGAVGLDFWVRGTGEQAGVATGFDA